MYGKRYIWKQEVEKIMVALSGHGLLLKKNGDRVVHVMKIEGITHSTFPVRILLMAGGETNLNALQSRKWFNTLKQGSKLRKVNSGKVLKCMSCLWKSHQTDI